MKRKTLTTETPNRASANLDAMSALEIAKDAALGVLNGWGAKG